jgi:predicted metalloprotease with PDZ domain
MNKVLLITILSTLMISAMAQSTVSYKLSMPEPHTHYFEVEMTIDQIDQKEIDVKMPVWTPGSYLVREFAQNVDYVLAKDAKGRHLDVEKINKNTWRIAGINSDKITIVYNVYAYDLTVRTSYLDDVHGYITGPSVFFYADGFQQSEHVLKVNPFEEWKMVSTALKTISAQNYEFEAQNYDELVDSPIEIGNHEEFEFTAAGVKHRVAMFGAGNYNVSRLKQDMIKIVEAATDVFGQNPNDEYLFIVHNLENSSGGLEHTASTTIQVNRWTYSEEKYSRFLSLVAHEYFHLWLVKRIRPKSLVTYNYDEENYTRLMWLMEGITSYYDELLLQRAGFISAEEYLSQLGNKITQVERQPGGKVQSLSASSFDAWIKAYRSNENSYNSTISYYRKGAVIGALLNARIVAATEGEKNLDHLLRYLYKKHFEKSFTGVSEEDVKRALEDICKESFDAFFDNYINGVETPDYRSIFGEIGIKVSEQEEKRYSLGIRTDTKGDNVFIQSVIKGGVAYNGGLYAGDELISLNDFRITNDNLITLLENHFSKESFEIVVNRDGLMRRIKIDVKPDTEIRYRLEKDSNPSVAEEKQLESFLKKG